jgi:PAS domain S-box-containing protein
VPPSGERLPAEDVETRSDLDRRLGVIADAGLAELSLDKLFEELPDRVRDVLDADSATVLLLDPAQDALVPQLSRGLNRGTDPVPVGQGIAGRVALNREPMIVDDVRAVEVVAPAVREGLRSLVAVPLINEGHLLGVLHVGSTRPRSFTEEDVRLVRLVGDRLAGSISSIRLHAIELEAREAAEREADRTRRLLALVADLSDAAAVQDVHRLLCEHASRVLDGATAFTFSVSPSGDLVAEWVIGFDEAALPPRVQPGADLPVAVAARTGASQWVSMSASGEAGRTLAGEPVGEPAIAAALPLAIGRDVFAVLGVRFHPSRPPRAGEGDLLVAMATEAAPFLERARLLEDDRETAIRARRLIQSNVVATLVGDDRGTVLEANDAFLELVGRSRAELDAGLVNWRTTTTVEHLEQSDAAIDELLSTGRSSAREREFVRPDGTHVPVLIGSVLLHRSPFRAMAYVVDLSEQRLAEEERRRVRERERALLEAAETARDRLDFVADASELLASSLDADEALANVAGLVVPRLAGWFAVDLVEEGGDIRPLAIVRMDPTVGSSDVMWRPLHPGGEQGVATVIRTGRSELLAEVPVDLVMSSTDESAGGAHLPAAAPRSAMIVPLSVGERVIGAMTLVRFDGRPRFERGDLQLAQDVGRRLAVAIENARLYEAEQRARRQAELATERLALIADFGRRLSRSLDLPTIAEILVRFSVRHVGDRAALELVGRDGRPIDTVSAIRDAVGEAVVEWIPADPGSESNRADALAARVVGEQRPVLAVEGHTPDADREAAAALLARLGSRSAIAAPLSSGEAILGSLAVGRESEPPLGPDDLELVEEICARAGQALDNARLFGERSTIAETLQRSLLPPLLPEVPGISVGAFYRPAGDGTQVGGDFYDLFESTPGEWGLVIGDVCGKGSPAAAVMALARYTVRTASLADSRPSSILETLNEALLRQSADDRFCTACYVRLRPNALGARLTVAAGGHPLPLLVRSDGDVEPVGRPGTLLGHFDDPDFSDQVVDMRPGDTLVLYTDGVTDERRGSEEFGERRLVDVLRSAAGLSPDDVCERLETALEAFRDDEPKDDIAVVALGVRG